MATKTVNSRYITTSAAAKLCAVTPDTVLKWIRTGRLPARRTAGGHNRIDRADLDRIMHPSIPAVDRIEPAGRRRFRYCWEFNGNGRLLEACRCCAVYLLRARRCYELARVAPGAVQPRVFCESGCAQCAYYREVHDQEINVLVITNDQALMREMRSAMAEASFNLEIADCEYSASAVLSRFKADFAFVDCSLGRRASRDIIRHLKQDPRVPFIRVVLAGNPGQAPAGCEKEIFARIERPLSLKDITECIEGISTADRSQEFGLWDPDRSANKVEVNRGDGQTER